MLSHALRTMAAVPRGSTHLAVGLARPAIAVAASSHLLAMPAVAAISSQSVRHAHNPRTIRGVGPAPRVASFYRRPWLKRRMTAARAKLWPRTHTTPTLDTTVQLAQAEAITLPTRSLETAVETGTTMRGTAEHAVEQALAGSVPGTVSLSPSIFNVPLRRDVIWEVVRWQRACRRQGTHKTKNRMEVFGSGKKARPQKGSGRARMGDPHAPHHVGGGNTWAKVQSDYSYKLPQQIINLGKRVALSAKLAEGNLFIIDEPVLSKAAPWAFMEAMTTNGWGQFTMVHLHGELDPNLAIGARRFMPYHFLSDRELNVYDIVNAKRLVITRKALQAIEWRLTKSNSTARTQARTMRWMVGSFGGGYTRQQIDFVKPADAAAAGKVVSGVDVDGLKMVIKSGEPYEAPLYWP